MRSDPYLIDSQKLSYHPERTAQWLQAKSVEERLKVFPLYVEISPVGHCNHRCTFCAVDYIGYQTRRLDTEILSAALLDMASHGVKSVMFAGEGEPMLHPDIAKLTVRARMAGLDVAFTTNGTALTDKFIETALSSVSWIKVSINGGEKTYAKIHQTKEADYEKVWNNLTRASAFRRDFAPGVVLGAQSVVLPDNLEDLPDIARRAREAGLDYVVFKPYSQHKLSNTKVYSDVAYRSQQQIFQELESLSSETFKVIVRRAAMEDWDAGAHKYKTCHATPYFWAYIMATGDVYSCSAYLLNERFNMGSINTHAFSDIWLGDKRRAHLEEMQHLDISECRVNCRMNQVNKYLDELVHPNAHASFI